MRIDTTFMFDKYCVETYIVINKKLKFQFSSCFSFVTFIICLWYENLLNQRIQLFWSIFLLMMNAGHKCEDLHITV